jgi:hypothetical protein
MIFDAETNGFLEGVTLAHSLVIRDRSTGLTHSCTEHEYESSDPQVITSDTAQSRGIEYGLRMLMEADVVVGHNILKYDIPVMTKLYPWFSIDKDKVFDTLIASRVIWADIKTPDHTRAKSATLKFPSRLIGSHSLDAWGHRLGLHKGSYQADNPDRFDEWDAEMQTYCELDVSVSGRLYDRCLKEMREWDWKRCIKLEHDFAHLLWAQELRGFSFDVSAAQQLYGTLAGKRESLRQGLADLFAPWYSEGKLFTPKKSSAKLHYTAGCPLTKVDLEVFDPGSRTKVANRLTTVRGWVPTEFAPKGSPKINDDVLQDLKYPEAKQLAEYYMLIKLLGYIAEGKKSWISCERNGRIHGSVITNGAVTGRCTHSNPNMGQIPSSKNPYGLKCRALFTASKGMVLVGVDAANLELRVLAHFLAFFGGKSYADSMDSGDKSKGTDPHSLAARIISTITPCDRETAKTFVYAMIYGAGVPNLGSTLGVGPRKGAMAKAALIGGIPGLKALIEAVKSQMKSNGGFIKGLDGRKLVVRSEHSVLNTLLQSGGAVVVKLATVLMHKEFDKKGWTHGTDYAMVAHVHDEVQIECRKEIADELGLTATGAIYTAGQQLNSRCPMRGDYKPGRYGANWSETH